MDFYCNKCENNDRETDKKDNRKINYFIGGTMIGFLVMLYGILSSSDFIIGIGIIRMILSYGTEI
mgnify:CR=1 FL=1